MTCPACGGELIAGGERCPVCDAVVAPRVEGALAPDPRMLTPPSRGRTRGESERAAPLRDIPALRKREHTWRDEVQERVRSRRQKRAKAGLPLFEQPEAGQSEPPASTALGAAGAPPAGHAAADAPEGVAARELDLRSTKPTESELADLPLRGSASGEGHPDRGVSGRRTHFVPLDEEISLGEVHEQPAVELVPPAAEPTPVERPARMAERAQAALVDAGIFVALAAVSVYFAGRAARANLMESTSSWPWLLAYLGLLGLFYAGYFTGTTGQTPGKLLTGLRVVGPTGRPPSYLRAILRAASGILGLALAGLGAVPMVFDPAGRALHDRLFHTRVVRH